MVNRLHGQFYLDKSVDHKTDLQCVFQVSNYCREISRRHWITTQVIDYEREKKEIETAIAKKEKEVSGQGSSLEDEQNQVRGCVCSEYIFTK